jgi:hypothetical protein
MHVKKPATHRRSPRLARRSPGGGAHLSIRSSDAAHAGAAVRDELAGTRGHMLTRILSFTLAAACFAAASPVHAYDPDPAGPSPDDPSAWGRIGERDAAPVPQGLQPCAPSARYVNAHSSYQSETGLDCRCDAAQAHRGGPARAEGAAARAVRGAGVESPG